MIVEKAFYGIGLRSRKKNQERTLEVHYLWIEEADSSNFETLKQHFSESPISVIQLQQISILQPLTEPLQKILNPLAKLRFKNEYTDKDIILYHLNDHSQPVTSVEEGYFKLHLISHRKVKPHQTNLAGMFGVLENLAWSNYGPILIEDLPTEKLRYLDKEIPLTITHVDKFPYLVNYHMPSGVRIADGSKVRLGAYLGEGSTVMPAGYVNFNAGSLGKAMIEGRISAGVLVGESSDIGGGGSIMGTLSGGNDLVISVGSKCLIGANAGIGISLGDGCTVAAGVYITAGSKVSLYNNQNQPTDSNGNIMDEGKNVVKAIELSGKDYLLFIQDSQNGKLICKPNQKIIELNESLHKFN